MKTRNSGKKNNCEDCFYRQIDGRTEALEFIAPLIEQFKELGYEEAAEMLDHRMEQFAEMK